MMELVAIRTLIKVDAFKHIPTTGGISLRDLSQKTGVQDDLLGMHSMLMI